MNSEMDRLAGVLELVRRHQPVVHAITNWVTAGDVAHALHALGARPVLAFAPEEIEEIVSGAGALMLNLGTPTPDRISTMVLAGRYANAAGKRVIFDPVGAGASEFRREACARILSDLRLSVIRGNQAEVGTLAGMGGKLRGVDAIAGPEDLREAARSLSERTRSVIVASGPRDLIASQDRVVTVENGHPLMARLTGTGCMLSAVIAAFLAVEEETMIATVAATAFFGLAGEHAGRRAAGPGSLKMALLDSLFTMTPDEMRVGVRLGT